MEPAPKPERRDHGPAAGRGARGRDLDVGERALLRRGDADRKRLLCGASAGLVAALAGAVCVAILALRDEVLAVFPFDAEADVVGPLGQIPRCLRGDLGALGEGLVSIAGAGVDLPGVLVLAELGGVYSGIVAVAASAGSRPLEGPRGGLA